MVHCYPLNDEQLHVMDVTCWCTPDLMWRDTDGTPFTNGPLIQHHAADGREIVEQVTGGSWTEDKKWANLITGPNLQEPED